MTRQLSFNDALRLGGIGSLLFGQANELAEKHNCHSLSIHVALSNTGAYNLYQRLGFTTQKTTKSLLMKLFLGHYSWVRMVNPLRPSTAGRLTMKRTWPLGLLSIVEIVQFPAILAPLNGTGSILGILNVLWFGWLSFLIPQRQPRSAADEHVI